MCPNEDLKNKKLQIIKFSKNNDNKYKGYIELEISQEKFSSETIT